MKWRTLLIFAGIVHVAGSIYDGWWLSWILQSTAVVHTDCICKPHIISCTGRKWRIVSRRQINFTCIGCEHWRLAILTHIHCHHHHRHHIGISHSKYTVRLAYSPTSVKSVWKLSAVMFLPVGMSVFITTVSVTDSSLARLTAAWLKRWAKVSAIFSEHPSNSN